jgi:hypothetical protein
MVVMDSIVENSLIVSRASNLCEDLVEEENVSLDESLEQLVQGAKGTHQPGTNLMIDLRYGEVRE